MDLAQVQMNEEAGQDAPGAPHYRKEGADIVGGKFSRGLRVTVAASIRNPYADPCRCHFPVV